MLQKRANYYALMMSINSLNATTYSTRSAKAPTTSSFLDCFICKPRTRTIGMITQAMSRRHKNTSMIIQRANWDHIFCQFSLRSSLQQVLTVSLLPDSFVDSQGLEYGRSTAVKKQEIRPSTPQAASSTMFVRTKLLSEDSRRKKKAIDNLLKYETTT
jgi:hypothetical protein